MQQTSVVQRSARQSFLRGSWTTSVAATVALPSPVLMTSWSTQCRSGSRPGLTDASCGPTRRFLQNVLNIRCRGKANFFWQWTESQRQVKWRKWLKDLQKFLKISKFTNFRIFGQKHKVSLPCDTTHTAEMWTQFLTKNTYLPIPVDDDGSTLSISSFWVIDVTEGVGDTESFDSFGLPYNTINCSSRLVCMDLNPIQTKGILRSTPIDPSQEMGSVHGVPAYCCCHGQKYKHWWRER